MEDVGEEEGGDLYVCLPIVENYGRGRWMDGRALYIVAFERFSGAGTGEVWSGCVQGGGGASESGLMIILCYVGVGVEKAS